MGVSKNQELFLGVLIRGFQKSGAFSGSPYKGFQKSGALSGSPYKGFPKIKGPFWES